MINILKDNKKYIEIVENLNDKNINKNDKKCGETLTQINNINFGAKVNFAYNLFKDRKNLGNCIYIVPNENEALKALEEFRFYTKNVEYFNQKEIKSFNILTESQEVYIKRMQLLNRIVEEKGNIYIITIEGYLQILIEKSRLFNKKYSFKLGEEIDLDKVLETLINFGYVAEDIAENRGEYSNRGGIIDIAFSEDEGLRIELFGNEIDSLRIYNLDTQKTVEKISKFEIDRINENILENSKDRVLLYLLKKEEDIVSGKINESLEEIQIDIEKIKDNNYQTIVEKYIDIFLNVKENFSQYILENDIVFYSDILKCNNQAQKVFEKAKEINESLKQKKRQIIQSISYFKENIFEEINKLKTKNIELIILEEMDNDICLNFKNAGIDFKQNEVLNYDFNIKEYNIPEIDIYNIKKNLLKTEKYANKKIELHDIYLTSVIKIIDSLLLELKGKENQEVYLVCGSGQNKVFEILKESLKTLKQNGDTYNIYIQNIKKEEKEYNLIEDFNLSKVKKACKITVLNGTIAQGYIAGSTTVIYLGMFFKKQNLRGKFKKKKLEEIVFADLNVGDYVVHKTHGIGKFVKIESKTVLGITKDYIMLEYAKGDKLYIPTDDLSNIKKYIGNAEENIKLSSLGTRDWERLTKKVKKSLREVAEELVKLYYKRESIKGYAFSNDTSRQYQFENEFPYIETDDQLRCIKEVKQDMQRNRPMERLLCGDVGFGKTEVAIRAAFKAVDNLKQVAYIVPTTVLARQQYLHFKQRMKEYDINVCELSRFKTKKEIEKTLEDLKVGKVDVVIGTHRILSSDVKFYDLGLLIIDEEHRFGVKDKEKIKLLKNEVDVLSMTATPIPRTMQMSLSGIRDMSIIYDAPQDRKAVKTYVVEYNDEIIQEAINNEIQRKGQVIYLHNKVKDIEFVRTHLEKILPNVVFDVAHGQMTAKQIEDKMQKFVEGDTDVLICTTIVESGIDIPNANTIIVEDADRLGLAQLYQIRGRVGRGKREAYAYITFKKNKQITDVAQKRLRAIKEFTGLGSGFKIATRDLEIRGAGSVFGEIQSGHMLQVGYETYVDLLNQSIKEIYKEGAAESEKGKEEQEEIINAIVDINIDSYIPDTYIKKTKYKMEIYQQLINERTQEGLKNILEDLVDRYGKFPRQLENFIKILEIRNMAEQIGISKILQGKMESNQNNIYIHINKKFKTENIQMLISKYLKAINFQKSKEKSIDGIIILNILEYAKIVYDLKTWEDKTYTENEAFKKTIKLYDQSKLELLEKFLRGIIDNEK